MRITRIDFEGQAGNHATAVRKRDSDQIEVTILTPDLPDGREHRVQADCEEDVFSMAQCLQHHLDGCRGTNSMIHDYYRESLKLSDC
ncbi:MAG: hypothetical protein HQ567_06780 [Candidatus Nealsonbacteria bacterium]|nr:hypothetical protein [Candidatus Nealsonbacteria bacterium]